MHPTPTASSWHLSRSQNMCPKGACLWFGASGSKRQFLDRLLESHSKVRRASQLLAIYTIKLKNGGARDVVDIEGRHDIANSVTKGNGNCKLLVICGNQLSPQYLCFVLILDINCR